MMNRREMLRSSVMAGSGLAFSQIARVAYGKDYLAPVKESIGLTAYQKDRRILVRYNNSPVLCNFNRFIYRHYLTISRPPASASLIAAAFASAALLLSSLETARACSVFSVLFRT